MGRQGDAYPDPRKMYSGKYKTKTLICIGLLLICLGSLIPAVSAPDPQPDPRFAPGPIFIEYPDSNVPVESPIMRNQATFMIE